MKNKGFTLIELLAVIVILAIIALIAVPIIINIINGTKEKSKEISKDLYLKAVEQAIARKNISEDFNPSTCTVQSNGNLLCDGEELVVEVEGEKPCSGTITITKGLLTGENIGYCDGTPTIPSNLTAQQKLESLLDKDNTDEIFEDENGNIRYRGKTEDGPKNYVTFNGETWRIIGFVDGHLRLIKGESIGKMAWDTNNSHDWTKASLMKYLNPSEVSNAGTDGEYWTKLTPKAKDMIEKTTWHLGGLESYDIKASQAYTQERKSEPHDNQPTTWEGYVGLMYPSDYGYAASEDCMTNKNLGSYNNSICQSSNWLRSGSYEWLQSPYLGDLRCVFKVSDVGFISAGGNGAIDLNLVRPVVNLKSEVKIIDGTGDSNDPYILGI